MCAVSVAAAAQTISIIRNDVIIYNNNFSKKIFQLLNSMEFTSLYS